MASVARTTIGVEHRLRQRLCTHMPIGGLKMPILVALIKGDPLVNVGGELTQMKGHRSGVL
jgi:hypothetical protein